MLHQRDPDEAHIDLSRYAERVGLNGRFYASHDSLMRVRTSEPIHYVELMRSFATGVDKLLGGNTPGRDWLEFKHWVKRKPGSSKLSPVKFRATMFMSSEATPWVLLSLSPRHSRGHSPD